MASNNRMLCPSAQPEWHGSQVIGVMAGSADNPQMVFLDTPQAVTKRVLDLTNIVSPAEVFRFAAPCAHKDCEHYAEAESKCRLAEHVVHFTPPVTEQLPICAIRAKCRWWQQEGGAACFRCPQVQTNNLKPNDEMRVAVYHGVL